MKLILASRSPARRELMKELGGPFECVTSDYHEDMKAYRAQWRLAEFLALGKAMHVAGKFPDALIIGADTFITCRGKNIGKPISIADAKRLIRYMSGHIIKVYTGVAVVQTDTKGNVVKKITDYAVTDLTIKKMSAVEVDLLAHQKDALHISGAFSIEGEGGKMITKIRGDYNNVIGLPMYLLEKMLKEITSRA